MIKQGLKVCIWEEPQLFTFFPPEAFGSSGVLSLTQPPGASAK